MTYLNKLVGIRSIKGKLYSWNYFNYCIYPKLCPPSLLLPKILFTFALSPLPDPLWETLLLMYQTLFCRAWHMGLFCRLSSFGISGQVFSLDVLFVSKRQLLVVSLCEAALLLLEFQKVPFVDLCFLKYTLIILQIMLNVILLFLMMMLLPTLRL